MKKHQYGFTLIEVLIAMFIFAIIMMMVIAGFSMVLRSNEKIRENHQQLSEIQRVVTIIARDFSQMVPRSVLDNDGTLIAGLVIDNESHRYEFTKGGYVNPFGMEKRSTLMRLAYVFVQDKATIIRRVWPVLDRAPSTNYTDYSLLSGVRNFSVQMLDENSAQYLTGSYDKLPYSLIFTIELENKQKITRVLALKRGNNA